MNSTVEYRTLEIPTDDLLRLKAAVGDRERELPAASRLQLTRRHTDGRDAYIAAEIKGVGAQFHIHHAEEAETGKPCWLVHHPEGGPMHEFPAVVDVANFVALGDGRLCKRSYGTGWSEPGRIVGGALAGAPGRAPIGAPANTTTTQGSKADVVSRGGAGSRRRFLPMLPMLGDRAGE
jgi:hypothetical protein